MASENLVSEHIRVLESPTGMGAGDELAVAALRRLASRNQNLVPEVIEALDHFATSPMRPWFSGAVSAARAALVQLDPGRRARGLNLIEMRAAAVLALVLSLTAPALMSTLPIGIRILTGGTALIVVILVGMLRPLWKPWIQVYSELFRDRFSGRPAVVVSMALSFAGVVRNLASGEAAQPSGGLVTLGCVALVAVEAELLWGRHGR